jgi:hypothetical protein
MMYFVAVIGIVSALIAVIMSGGLFLITILGHDFYLPVTVFYIVASLISLGCLCQNYKLAGDLIQVKRLRPKYNASVCHAISIYTAILMTNMFSSYIPTLNSAIVTTTAFYAQSPTIGIPLITTLLLVFKMAFKTTFICLTLITQAGLNHHTPYLEATLLLLYITLMLSAWNLT